MTGCTKPDISAAAPRQRRRSARAFWLRETGNVAIVFAIILPVLMLGIGAAIDYSLLTSERRRAQFAADTASLAGAKELSLADANKSNVSSVVEAVVNAYLTRNAKTGVRSTFSTETNIIDTPGAPLQVDVRLSLAVNLSFGGILGMNQIEQRITSVAVVVGKPNVCMLALDPSARGTIYLQKNAQIVGQNCGIFSNSTSPNGIKAYDSSKLTASVICSAGGKDGGKGNFQPQALTDCPTFTDPLNGRPEPSVGSCIATNLTILNQTVTLPPGTYCGGIKIAGTSRVTFEPGVFVFSDGALLVQDSAVIAGDGVGMFFTGTNARFSFAQHTSISLTAPTSGIMAGMLFFGSRSQSNIKYEILSDDARQLLGTIYLPTGKLSIDANQPIADKSAYTAIVALQITADAGPTVTLNTNYSLTDVPVPDGIRGAGQPAVLTK